jgi:hypothetical protein
MRMKASEVGDWVRQIAGKRDHREVVSDDYLVLRPGPNFHWLMGMLDDTPAPAQSLPTAPECIPMSDDLREAEGS